MKDIFLCRAQRPHSDTVEVTKHQVKERPPHLTDTNMPSTLRGFLSQINKCATDLNLRVPRLLVSDVRRNFSEDEMKRFKNFITTHPTASCVLPRKTSLQDQKTPLWFHPHIFSFTYPTVWSTRRLSTYLLIYLFVHLIALILISHVVICPFDDLSFCQMIV